jgi:hypothetical protein
LPFRLFFTPTARDALSDLEVPAQAVRLKKVRNTLGRLQADPRYPSLNSHKYSSVKGINGEEIWESYVENNTPSAWRIFWHYGPGADCITVVSITPHP